MHAQSSGDIQFRFETTSDSTAQIQYKNGNNQWSAGIDNLEQFFVYDSTNAHSALTFIPLNEVVFNQNSKDVDFRVESDANANFLLLDASAEMLLVGGGANTAGGAAFKVTQSNDGELTLDSTSSESNIVSYDRNGSAYHPLNIYGSNVNINPTAGNAAIFNEASLDADFRVESDNVSNMLQVDAGNNRLNIGGSPQTYSSNRVNIYGDNVNPPGAANGNLAVYAVDSQASGNGGSISLGGRYTDAGAFYQFGAIQAVKKNSTSGNAAGLFKLYYVNSANGTNPFLEASEDEIVFNNAGLDDDFRVESENNTHMLYLNAEKDTVRLGNGGGNSAPLSFHKGKSSRYFSKYIDSTSAAAAKVADLMKIDSWQSGNSRLFGTVTFWSVNPVGDYANYGRASFFAKNTSDGTGNTVTTFTELEEKGTMALPTLTWTGTGLRTLTFNMPAVAYQKYIVDITFVTADGATTTLYDDAAVGVDP